MRKDKLGIEEKAFILICSAFQKYIRNKMLNDEILETFSLKSETRP